jgi:hypothetical protein
MLKKRKFEEMNDSSSISTSSVLIKLIIGLLKENYKGISYLHRFIVVQNWFSELTLDFPMF